MRVSLKAGNSSQTKRSYYALVDVALNARYIYQRIET